MKRALLSVVLLLAFLEPASADWIVPRTGPPIETDGAWQTRGSGVVFRGTDGGFYLLPASDVDWRRTRLMNLHPARLAVGRFAHANGLEIADRVTLDRVVSAMVDSHRAGEAAVATAPRRPPRLVLTDADVAHVVPRVDLPADEFPVEWRRSYDDVEPGELAIVGTLSNRSESTVSRVELQASILDHENRPREVLYVEVEPAVVPPGAKATFRVLPRQGDFSEISFRARGRLEK